MNPTREPKDDEPAAWIEETDNGWCFHVLPCHGSGYPSRYEAALGMAIASLVVNEKVAAQVRMAEIEKRKREKTLAEKEFVSALLSSIAEAIPVSPAQGTIGPSPSADEVRSPLKEKLKSSPCDSEEPIDEDLGYEVEVHHSPEHVVRVFLVDTRKDAYASARTALKGSTPGVSFAIVCAADSGRRLARFRLQTDGLISKEVRDLDDD